MDFIGLGSFSSCLKNLVKMAFTFFYFNFFLFFTLSHKNHSDAKAITETSAVLLVFDDMPTLLTAPSTCSIKLVLVFIEEKSFNKRTLYF